MIILPNYSAPLISLKADAGLIANSCCIFKRFNLGCLRRSGEKQRRPLFCDACAYLCAGDMWQPYRQQVRPGVLEWCKIRPAPFLLRWSVIITPHHSLTNTHLHLYYSLFLVSFSVAWSCPSLPRLSALVTSLCLVLFSFSLSRSLFGCGVKEMVYYYFLPFVVF